jgi:hypothetical protein
MLQRAGAVVVLTHSYQVFISALISAAVAIRIAAPGLVVLVPASAKNRLKPNYCHLDNV